MLGRAAKLNLFLFTVWSLQLNELPPLFLTIVPHSLKHLSLKCLQRQMNRHRESQPASRGEEAQPGGQIRPEIQTLSLMGWGWGDFLEILQKSPKLPFSLINGTSRHLQETSEPAKCPEFQRPPWRRRDIADVNICKNLLCPEADGWWAV